MGDLYWGQTKLLLHCDGTDGSTTFADETGKTVTANGNAQIDTAQSKFGMASALFDGIGDYLSAPNSADWNFGSGDFTVEAWLRLAATPTQHNVIACNWPTTSTSAWRFLILDIGRLHFNWVNTLGQTHGMSSTSSPAVGAWTHVAISRQGNVFRLFVDGVLEASASYDDEIRSSGGALNIGRNDEAGVWHLNGHLDDLRITKGVARYTATFTPPTAALDSGYLTEQAEAPITVTVAITTEQSEAPITVTVHTTEQAEAAITVTVVHTTERAEAPITVTVAANLEQSEAPITITVSHVTEQSEAPIRVLVSGTEQSEAPIAVAVTDGWPTVWAARVVLDGVEVTDRVTGAIRIRMEEGAARIASLALVPTASPINPIWYVGKPISVDFVHGAVPLRIFTGRVDLPSYDPDTRIVALSCTDDLQNRVAALTRAEIDALTGGGYHRAVHGEIDDNWDYAQASMLTHPAALDAGPHGGLRITPWEGLPVWRTFDAVLDDSMDLDLPRRQDIVNRVNVRFDYRYHRLRERSIGVAWHMAWFLPEAEAAGFQFPDSAGIMSALGGAGWTVRSAVFYPCPAQVNYAGGTVRTTGDTDSMAAVLGLRYGQTVTETASLTVTAPESIAGNGEIAQDLRCTLASEWSPNEWESDWSVAPADVGAGQDYAPDADRADAEAGMASALAQAQTLILARHRNCRLAFDLPLTPALDVDRAVAVDAPVGTGSVQAGGKVWAVEHRLDPDAGSAITRVTLALSGVAAAGLATPTVTPLTPPDPPDIDAATGADDYSPPHMLTMVAGQAPYFGNVGGWIVQAPETINVSTGAVPNPWYDAAEVYPETGFRVLLDGVPDSHRQPLEIASAKSYEIAIPADPLVMM